MHKPLLGEKIAVLVANGFNEKDLTEMQRAIQPLGGNVRIISMDSGLVNSWNNNGWGLNFAADNTLSEALAADFSMLIIPGGQRSVEKLKLTAHTRRFIRGFVDSNKPVVACGDALDLMIFAEKVTGRSVSGPESLKAVAEAAGAVWSGSAYTVDKSLMTGAATEGDPDYVRAAVDFLVSGFSLVEAA